MSGSSWNVPLWKASKKRIIGRGRRLLLNETESQAADHATSVALWNDSDIFRCRSVPWLPLFLWMLMGQMEWRMAEFFKCKRSLVLLSIGMQVRDGLWIRAKKLAVDQMRIIINWIGNQRMKDIWKETYNRFYLRSKTSYVVGGSTMSHPSHFHIVFCEEQHVISVHHQCIGSRGDNSLLCPDVRWE